MGHLIPSFAVSQSVRSGLFVAAGCWLTVSLFSSTPEHSLGEGLYDPRGFLQEYCIGCHGDKKQKGDRRFDHLGLDLSVDDAAFEWQEILDLVNLGEMPPEDEVQPSHHEVSQMVSWVTPKLDDFYALQIEKETTGLRRLTSFQYFNTVRDLLGLNVESFNPTSSFPSEEKLDGFDNIAGKLVTSRYLMEKYLEAASASIDKVIDIPSQPQRIEERFTADDFWEKRLEFRARVRYVVNVEGKYVEMGHGGNDGLRIYPDAFEGVPQSGYYTITVKAEGAGRQHPYDPSLFKMDFAEPIQMELFANDQSIASAANENPTSRAIETFNLEDNTAKEYRVRVWLDRGFNFGLRYANGPLSSKNTFIEIQETYHPETITSNYLDEFAQEPSEELERYLSDAYQGPRVRVHWASIEGPEVESWPPQNYRELLGAGTHGGMNENPHRVIRAFASKAFRRPALRSETARYTAFFDGELSKGSDAVEALANTFKAILCSPSFIYIETPLAGSAVEEEGFNPKAYALASRLSYFLWGTMPDPALRDAAKSGAILKPIELRYQALRMLRDPRSEVLVSHFTDGWLGLHKLGQILPDPVKHDFYNTHNLERSMREETRSFFRYILAGNRNIEEFLSGDYSFVDRNLAKHYGIDYTNFNEEHEMVSYPAGSFRGGLLGQAGIHTVTANGVDTSPVTRGIWILENLLGTPPAPPPPDVPSLEPDIRGATSMRDQLSKHREIATCNECHRKMDPLGFAMESFDAIGGFRDYYKTGSDSVSIPVDTSGKLPSGEAFEDVRGLRDILVGRQEQFSHCLTEKLMMYALGRELSFSDRPQVNSIVEELQRRGGGLQDLVEIIVTSETFRAF